MEDFMKEVRAYAVDAGIQPTTVVQRAGAGNGSTWAKWERGGSATHRTTDKVREYMTNNPVNSEDAA